MPRGSGTRKQKTSILMVCEGETEEKYLKALKSYYRLTAVKVEVKNAKVESAQEIVKTAKKEIEYAKRKGSGIKFEEVYCVFDNDNKNMQTEILPAVNQMIKEGFLVIYSNISFEMWLGMHYDDFVLRPYRNPQLVESELKRYDENFHKTKYDVNKYINKISKAKSESKSLISKNVDYPKSCEELKVNPYTNMAKLIERLEYEKNK